jgi:4-hydroxythreonine-4-phosphate dehydrogenase
LIAITMGDPSGIGPEVVVKVFSDTRLYRLCHPLLIGDLSVLREAAKLCRVKLRYHPIQSVKEALFTPGTLDLFDLRNVKKGFRFGRPTLSLGHSMVEYIQRAVSLALAGEVDAITTAPISKASINRAGFHYPGHTELLADLTGTKEVAMMLVGGPFRITLVTTHLSIQEVPKALTEEKVFQAISLTQRVLEQDFGLRAPRIAVASLNPHGGEGGLLGSEEERVILPAMERARHLGIRALGPLPPDTLFYKARQERYDGIVVMYHDQGLIPLKMVAFGKAVNLTLGLPIIRTSVDHGTAHDIAGKGIADPSSLFEAIRLATQLARHRHE